MGDAGDDETWMGLALDAARSAGAAGEVPVGAIVVVDGAVIATAANRREADADPTAHAEVLALRAAAAALGTWRLTSATLVVTLEPCAMCAGAILHARLHRVVYGARDPKAGADGSVLQVLNFPQSNHKLEVVEGISADACATLLRDFFAARR
jgi:tRNA(adenine34) deaminase